MLNSAHRFYHVFRVHDVVPVEHGSRFVSRNHHHDLFAHSCTHQVANRGASQIVYQQPIVPSVRNSFNLGQRSKFSSDASPAPNLPKVAAVEYLDGDTFTKTRPAGDEYFWPDFLEYSGTVRAGPTCGRGRNYLLLRQNRGDPHSGGAAQSGSGQHS